MSTSLSDGAGSDSRIHARALVSLGVPLIGSHLAQLAVTITDTVMVGWYDVTALAGLTLAGSIWFVAFVVGSGFAFAVMPMVAAAAGTENDRQVRRVTRMGLWLTLAYAAVVVPVLAMAGDLYLWLGQPPDVADQAALYMSVAAWGLVPNLLIMVLKSYLSALERTRVILWVTIGMALVNAAVNYVLIFGHWGFPEMGILGAAIATISVGVVGLAGLGIYAAVVTANYDLFRNFVQPDWGAFGEVFRLGWPIALTYLAEVGLFSASSVLMGWVGVLELAAHGIALQIASATFMVQLGLSQAVTVRAGRAFGQRDRLSLRTGARVAMAMSLAFAAVTVVLFVTVPEPLVALFLDPGDPHLPEIVAIGVVLLAMAALFQTLDAAQVMALGMLRGVQDTRVPMVMAAVSYWGVGVPASYALGFPLGLGAAGIWLGLAIGLGLAGLLLSWRFWMRSSLI